MGNSLKVFSGLVVGRKKVVSLRQSVVYQQHTKVGITFKKIRLEG